MIFSWVYWVEGTKKPGYTRDAKVMVDHYFPKEMLINWWVAVKSVDSW
jgi:hypothetical protein